MKEEINKELENKIKKLRKQAVKLCSSMGFEKMDLNFKISEEYKSLKESTSDEIDYSLLIGQIKELEFIKKLIDRLPKSKL